MPAIWLPGTVGVSAALPCQPGLRGTENGKPADARGSPADGVCWKQKTNTIMTMMDGAGSASRVARAAVSFLSAELRVHEVA